MQKYVNLDEAIEAIIAIGRDRSIEESNPEAPGILGRYAADIVYVIQHLDIIEE